MEYMTYLMLAVFSLNLVGGSTQSMAQCLNDQLIWSNCDNTDFNYCGEDLSWAVHCDTQNNIWIQPCYCLYYDINYNITIAGHCMYSCFYTRQSPTTGSIHFPIKRYQVQNYSLFNYDMCSVLPHLNREGRFCGKCKNNYGLPVYSYHYTFCIPCKNYGYKNWIKVLTSAFLPLTVLYVVLVIFRISITSSHLNGLVFTIHCCLSPTHQRVISDILHQSLSDKTITKSLATVFNVMLSLLSIFNLDFFRNSLPEVCVHPNLNMLHVLSLEFVVGLYPFALILLTYCMIILYDKNYSFLVWAWKPFKKCIQVYNQQFQAQASLIETFASFTLLSSAKLLATCLNLLLFFTTAYNQKGHPINTKFFYYDATIEYFSTEHLPYAMVALCIGLIFIVVPFLLLFLYPNSYFQKLLNTLNFRCQALHIFMDAFHGIYKVKPRDMRYFAAFYFFQRMVFFFLISQFTSHIFLLVAALLLLSSAVVVLVLQPYKKQIYNKFDTFFLILSACCYLSFFGLLMTGILDHSHFSHMKDFLILTLSIFFCTYILALLWGIPCTYKLWKKIFCILQHYKHKVQNHFKFNRQGNYAEGQASTYSYDESAKISSLMEPVGSKYGTCVTKLKTNL